MQNSIRVERHVENFADREQTIVTVEMDVDASNAEEIAAIARRAADVAVADQTVGESA